MRRDLHHVAVVVADVQQALGFWRDRVGLEVRTVHDVEDQQVRIAFLRLGNALLELVQPLDEASGVARYLAARGGGALHHVCFTSDDLASELGALAAAGVELVDPVPRAGALGQVAFLHPRAADGVLVELIDRASLADPKTRAE